MIVLRALGLLVLTLAGLVALLFLLPFLKEGFDADELPRFLATTAFLGAVALVWWRINRRARGFRVAGVALLGVPLLAYIAVSSRVTVNDWQGRRLERSVRVVSLRETPLSWPGLDGPVGIRLEVELDHAIGREGNLFAPKIVMSADPRPDRRDYFFGAMDHGIDPYLGPAAFELTGPPRDVLARTGRARLVYELFPSTLSRREGDAACLTDRAGDRLQVRSHGGSDLGAAWFFAAPGGLYVDLSAPLTGALRRSSALQGRHDEWQKMMDRASREALRAAGWRECLPDRHVAETCFCAPASAASEESGLATRERPTVP